VQAKANTRMPTHWTGGRAHHKHGSECSYDAGDICVHLCATNRCIHACLLLQGRCGNVDVYVFTHAHRQIYVRIYFKMSLYVLYNACIHACYAAAAKTATVATACMLWRVCACEDSADHPSGYVIVCMRACVCGISLWINTGSPTGPAHGLPQLT
jgi:hypothetical protein